MGNKLTDYCLVQVVAHRFPAGEIVESDALYDPHWTGPEDFENYLDDVPAEEAEAWKRKHIGFGPGVATGDVVRPNKDLIGLYFSAAGTRVDPAYASPLEDNAGQIGWVDTLGEEQIAELLEDVLLLLSAHPESAGCHLLTVWRFHVDVFHYYESSYPEVDTWADYLGPFDDSRLKEMIVQTKEDE